MPKMEMAISFETPVTARSHISSKTVTLTFTSMKTNPHTIRADLVDTPSGFHSVGQ